MKTKYCEKENCDEIAGFVIKPLNDATGFSVHVCAYHLEHIGKR